jgi:hypothetical protein
MKLKAFFSRLANARLSRQARIARRTLRDFQRQESSRIFAIEKRARGLRLYAAWSRKPASTSTVTNWQARLSSPAAAAFVKPLESAALA